MSQYVRLQCFIYKVTEQGCTACRAGHCAESRALCAQKVHCGPGASRAQELLVGVMMYRVGPHPEGVPRTLPHLSLNGDGEHRSEHLGIDPTP